MQSTYVPRYHVWLLLTLTATLPGLSLALSPSTEERTKSSCLRLRIQFALWAAGLLCNLGRLCPTRQVGLPQRDPSSGIPTPILLALISGLQPQSPGLSILPQLFPPHGQLFGELPGLPRPFPGCAPGSSATLGSGPGVVPGIKGSWQRLGLMRLRPRAFRRTPDLTSQLTVLQAGWAGLSGKGWLKVLITLSMFVCVNSAPEMLSLHLSPPSASIRIFQPVGDSRDVGWGLGHSCEWAREGQELPTSWIGLQSGGAAPESHRAGFNMSVLLLICFRVETSTP